MIKEIWCIVHAIDKEDAKKKISDLETISYYDEPLVKVNTPDMQEYSAYIDSEGYLTLDDDSDLCKLIKRDKARNMQYYEFAGYYCDFSEYDL